MSDVRTVVVTGVSRGLGLAMTEALIELGHTVAGCARNSKAVEQLSQRFAAPHLFDTVDVADDDQVRAWSGRVLESVGPPDLLLNNAALVNANASLWEVPAEEFSRVVDVNINGVFHVILSSFSEGRIQLPEREIV